ncbi:MULTISPECIES: GNAT family N-acetyltransferase [Niastella]|uniref:GNAT family N-acetyltransferase n=1 Tax=Niastella soli TaxID=2821487 RepID=A0ABS3Z348_9BACT|nr:GNAT family N-acetyltransferase [Niastella soli]MBO9204587.1 GNAT family N-acetyltransferase [Niastella soli]
MVIFETERLIIRRYTFEDEENFFRLNGDPELMRYIREARDRKECSLFLRRNIIYYEQHPLMGRWAMDEKATGAFIGSFAIIPVESVDAKRHKEIQLGYALLKDYWGKGYATESTIAGKQYAFEVMKLSRIVAITETANIASQKVLLRCGFEQQPNIQEGNKTLCYFTSSTPDVIETERLHLFPLTIPQLELYCKSNDELEKTLNLTPFGRAMAPPVHDRVVKETLPLMRKAPSPDYLFYTFWLVVDKLSRTIVAEIGFKGPPTMDGCVEIGYGTMPNMQRKGYMTEAVKGLLKWACRRSDITTVLAETNAGNKPSIRVVEKNGFNRFEQKGDMYWWRYKVNRLTS